MASRFDIALHKVTGAPIWVMIGGRPCPFGVDDCSQSVYEEAYGKFFDHGYPGGPAYEECRKCKKIYKP